MTKITGPTVLTIFRMFLSVIFLILILIPTQPTHILALITFIAAAVSDFIDGKWARKYQKVTDLGAFLDPLADKMLTSLAFLALIDLEIIPLGVFAIILVRDFAVDGMRMMAAREGVTIAASRCGKWKTALQLIALIIFLANFALFGPETSHEVVALTAISPDSILTIIGNIVLYIALFLTIISGFEYLRKNWRRVIK